MRWLKNLKFNNVFYPYYTESLNIKVENNLRPEKKTFFVRIKLMRKFFNWKLKNLTEKNTI